MLTISLLLHGLVLALPMQEDAKRPEPVATPTPKERVKVKITSLTGPSAPKPAPKKPAKVRKPTPKKANRVKPLVRPPSDPLPAIKPKEEKPEEPKEEEKQTEEQQPEEQPSDSKQADDNTTDPKQQEDKSSDPKQPQDSKQDGSGLIGPLRERIVERTIERLKASGEGTYAPDNVAKEVDTLPIELVDESKIDISAFFGEVTDPPKLKDGAVGSLNIPKISAREAYETELKPILEEFGFTIELPQEYGGADLYKVRNAEGLEFYMSVVRQKLGSGAFIVFWSKAPGS